MVVTVFLGDDPNYYIHGKKFILFTVMYADSVITTDTGWIDSLKLVGVKKVIYSPLGTDTETFFPLTPSDEDKEKYGNDGDPFKLYQLLVKQISLANTTFIELPDIE